MKIIYILAAILLFLSHTSHEYDTISNKNISVSKVSIGDNVETVNNLIGKPDSIVKTSPYGNIPANLKDDIEMPVELKYYYGKSYFVIENNKVLKYFIAGNELTLDHVDIKIGDCIEKLKGVFPKSSERKRGNSVCITIIHEEILTDAMLCFSYKEGKVSSIELWEPL